MIDLFFVFCSGSLRGPDYDVGVEMKDLQLAMLANNAKEKISPRELVHQLWCQKFRLPFMFLAVLFVFIGSSGFSYIAFNSVDIFEVYYFDLILKKE